MDLYGKKCVSCNEVLLPTDDIVVCPDCGAPYHRACYEKEGKCLFSDKHSATYNYAPERPHAVEDAERIAENETAERTKLCMRCYTRNDADAIFCTNCGAPMNEPNTNTTDNINSQNKTDDFNNNIYSQLMLEPINPEEEIDGIKAKHWATYLGNNAPYYLYQFKRMDKTKRKTTFCWSAIFFSPLYFAYRKAWLWSLISLLSFAILNIPYFGYLLGLTGSQFVLPLTESSLLSLQMICSFLSCAVQIFWGVFAIYFVRKESAKKLKAMQETNTMDSSLSEQIKSKAGPTWAGPCIIIGIYMLFIFGFMTLLGPNISNLYNLFFY